MASPDLGKRSDAFAAQTAALRTRMVALTLEVARVEDELATTLDRLAQRHVSRADELHARATAARSYAESERAAARRLTDGQ